MLEKGMDELEFMGMTGLFIKDIKSIKSVFHLEMAIGYFIVLIEATAGKNMI